MRGNGCALLLLTLVLLMVFSAIVMGLMGRPAAAEPAAPAESRQEGESKEPRGNNMDWFGARKAAPGSLLSRAA